MRNDLYIRVVLTIIALVLVIDLAKTSIIPASSDQMTCGDQLSHPCFVVNAMYDNGFKICSGSGQPCFVTRSLQ